MDKSSKVSNLTPVNLYNNPLVSYSLINFNLLLLHAAHSDKSIILLFLIFANFGFWGFFSTLETIR